MTDSPATAQASDVAQLEAAATERASAANQVVDGVGLATPGTYVLDPTHTRIGFAARHLMVTKVRGSFKEFEGSITVGDDPATSTAQASIQTASIDTGTADRDAHLRSADFLEVEKFPTMTFGNAQVVAQDGARLTVTGDLTIKDTTRPVTLTVEVDGMVRDPWGNQKLAFTARTEIDREDFGLTWNVALESGGVLVSKKVVIEIEGQAARQG